jgi:hypothetical protein
MTIVVLASESTTVGRGLSQRDDVAAVDRASNARFIEIRSSIEATYVMRNSSVR